MTVFWSVLTVMGALSATEASAANWNDGRYAPVGIVDQLKHSTVSQQGVRESEPAPIVLAEARTAAKLKHDVLALIDMAQQFLYVVCLIAPERTKGNQAEGAYEYARNKLHNENNSPYLT